MEKVEDKTYLELIIGVVRNRAKTSMELFGVEMKWTGFDTRVRDSIEDETGESAPTTMLGATVEYFDR